MISELANTPFKAKLGEKEYLISRMPISELYGPAEQHVRTEYKSNMMSIAAELQGKEKMQYLNEATRDIPKGSELLAAAQEYLSTPEGYFDLLMRALSKHQTVNEGEVLNAITKASDIEKTTLIAFIMGTDYETTKVALSTTEEDSKKKLT